MYTISNHRKSPTTTVIREANNSPWETLFGVRIVHYKFWCMKTEPKKNTAKSLGLVRKTRNFVSGTQISIEKFHPGKKDYLFRCFVNSWKFPVERTKKSCAIYIPTRISGIFFRFLRNEKVLFWIRCELSNEKSAYNHNINTVYYRQTIS